MAGQSKPPLVQFSLTSGYQSTDLRWSIAGNIKGESPNILSEVIWNRLTGPIISGDLKFNVYKNIFVGVTASSASIKSGFATDNDYANNDREGATYHADLNADDGFVRKRSAYIGYNLINKRRVTLSIKAGYEHNKEQFYLLDHKNDITDGKKLRSVYNTQWGGFTGGINLNYHISNRVSISDETVYEQMNYNANADWNLIDAFQHPVSFTQRAEGFTLLNTLSCTYQLKSFLSVFIIGALSHSETGKGVDNLYLESGVIKSTQLNGVYKKQSNIQAGITIRL